METISKEINEFKELLKRVECGHSFSIVNYESIFENEVEIEKKMNTKREVNFLYKISDYDKGSFMSLTKEEAFYELEKWLKEAFDFNVRFSSKISEANQIESEVGKQIERIMNLVEDTFLKTIKFERRMVDIGGYDLVRLDFKQIEMSEVFEFNYIID